MSVLITAIANLVTAVFGVQTFQYEGNEILAFILSGNGFIIEKRRYDFLRYFAWMRLMMLVECGINLVDLHQKEIVEPNAIRHGCANFAASIIAIRIPVFDFHGNIHAPAEGFPAEDIFYLHRIYLRLIVILRIAKSEMPQGERFLLSAHICLF